MNYDDTPWWVIDRTPTNGKPPEPKYSPKDYKTASEGYVYILSNPSLKGQLKIGMTTREVHKRVEELNSSTSIPTKFTVEYTIKCSKPYEKEQQIHTNLRAHRVNIHREFFEIDLKRAIEEVQKVCEEPYVAELRQEIKDLKAEVKELRNSGHSPELQYELQMLNAKYSALCIRHNKMVKLNKKLMGDIENYVYG
jgi:hypothetical protein